MNKEILEQIKVNSGIPVKTLVETDTSDIANTQDFLSHLIDEKYNDSLAYQICEITPMNSTLGVVYASKRNNNSEDFEVIKKNIYSYTDKISTGFTREVWDDMVRVFDKTAKQSAGNVLSGISRTEENLRVLTLLRDESEVKSSLTITDPNSFEGIIQQVSKKVSESVIEMNYKSYNTLSSFCILGPKWAAAILGSFSYMTEGKEKSLFVGRVGRTDYYINPLPNTAGQFNDDYNYDFENEPTNSPDYAYVGLQSSIPGQSSLIFAPYMYELQNIVDPDTLDTKLFLYNRYGLVTTPLHDKIEGKGKLHKFEIIAGE